MRRKIIAVIGASEPSNKERKIAFEVGRLVAKNNLVLLNGGYGGVMEESARGAKKEGGTVIGIIMTADPNDANQFTDIVIATGMGDGRNSIIANTADCFIAVGKGLGTLSEIAFALKRKKKVIGISTWQIERVRHVDSPKKALESLLP